MPKTKTKTDPKRIKKKGVTLIGSFQMDNDNHEYVISRQRAERDKTGIKPTIGEVIDKIVTEQRKIKTTKTNEQRSDHH